MTPAPPILTLLATLAQHLPKRVRYLPTEAMAWAMVAALGGG